MPKASPLPRKYASLIDEAQSNLRLIAHKAKAVVAHLESNARVSPHVQTALREVETLAYRTALDLAEIEVAGGCDGCPSAPPITTVQAHLLVLADTLEHHAAEARQAAMTPYNAAAGRAMPLQSEPTTGNGVPMRLIETRGSAE